MVVYIINPEYVLNEMDDQILLFTANMEKIYIFNVIEQIILLAFVEPTTIKQAVELIREHFCSFKENECIEYIDKLISENILTECCN